MGYGLYLGISVGRYFGIEKGLGDFAGTKSPSPSLTQPFVGLSKPIESVIGVIDESVR